MGRSYVFILYVFVTASIVLVKDSVQDNILLDEETVDCNCGANSASCEMVNGSVICNCNDGFSQNGEYCHECDCGENSTKCFFENGTKTCECKDGFFDNNGICAADFCWKDPCKNGGTCLNSEHAYKCKCVEPYSGENCTEHWCERNLKDCRETCVYDPLLKDGYCECKENQVFDETKKKCTAIDPCLSKLLKGECSKPHETCESGDCKCKKNYKYSENNDSCVANFCEEKDSCPPYSSCKELESGNVQCTCDDEYYRKDGECERVNRCLFSGCNQKCDWLGVCSCFDGFELSKDNKTCTSSTVKCDRDCGDLTCVKTGDAETCHCPESTHTVLEGEVCKSLRDVCNETRKAPDDLCSTKKCEPADNSIGYRCVCEGVYKQAPDGVRCERKVMCEEEGKEECAKKFAICKEVPKNDRPKFSFQCVCGDGYEEDDQGVCRKKCELREHIEGCADKSAICDLDEKFNVVCRCPPMLKMKDEQCTQVAEFSYLGKLRVLKKKYEIQPSDARFSKSSYNIDVSMLITDLKSSLGNLEEIEDLKLLNYRTDGDDIDCSVEVQLVYEPTLNLNKIKTGKFCTPVSKSDYCLVKPELFIKKSTEDVFHRISNPCEQDIKDKLCGKATRCVGKDLDDFQCICLEGYETIGILKPFNSPKSYIQFCSDIDECKVPSICPDSTICKNTIGGYECQCKQGYIQKPEADTKKEGCKRLCEPNPCQNGECVVIDGNSWTCNCNANWTGILCNTSVAIIITKEDRLASANTTAIVGGVLGALLAVVLIAFIAVLLKKKKGGLDQDDYITQRQQGVRSEMSRMAQRKQFLEEEQVADSRGRRDSGERARQSRQERILPRAQISRRTEERPRQSTNEPAYYKNSAYVGD